MKTPISRRTASLIATSVAVLAAVIFLPGWGAIHPTETTDNAQVEGHISDVGVRVDGTLSHVYAENNQRVAAGQLLADLDPAEYRLALTAARWELARLQAETSAESSSLRVAETSDTAGIRGAQSELKGAHATLEGLVRSHAAALSRVQEAEVPYSAARTEAGRATSLFAEGLTSRRDYERAVSTRKLAAATLETARAGANSAANAVDRQRIAVAEAEQRLEHLSQEAPLDSAIHRANIDMRSAAARAAQARVERAILNLDNCRIKAPASGIVIRRAAEVGRHVTVGESLFQIVQTDNLWVTANFKETQLRRIQPGQRISMTIDAFPGVFQGEVESLGGATGSIASVLPPENATGNYIKVVQRLPVRIRFAPGQPLVAQLRPGMSVVPTVSAGR
jgi:membrane fusion protein (multidrug efflux system)